MECLACSGWRFSTDNPPVMDTSNCISVQVRSAMGLGMPQWLNWRHPPTPTPAPAPTPTPTPTPDQQTGRLPDTPMAPAPAPSPLSMERRVRRQEDLESGPGGCMHVPRTGTTIHRTCRGS
ncbi:hypothetical protein CDEST_00654 [Colletotrichum destructivum]|uniref:Uncharacterized protein n=1 Tax=Colletotrichum destructivum TaxID=34406 RepID=A0AAX4HX27_9PEZI|nr:hypothetical protein CDEST_00654 [Colletotrichum destructivum]